MNKREMQKYVTQNGKPLPLSKFVWNESTNSFYSREDNLVITGGFLYYNFKTGSDCTFNTDSYCTFETGDNCTFETGDNCTFSTGDHCTFNTGSYCTFDTDSDCTFNTKYNCTFKTGADCTFNTGSYCAFETDYNCTFSTGSDCTFNTDCYCTFNTSSLCTFETDYRCKFNTGYRSTFKTGDNCTFNTDSDCTFETGHDCTFNTTSDCTFETSHDCIFNTQYSCTFKAGFNSVILRRDTFETIQPLKNEVIKLCPTGIKGYISKREDEDAFYMCIDGERVEHVISDNILSKVINKKGNVYHVVNYGEDKETFLITDGENWSHGETLEKAKDSLMYKISNRDTSKYKNLTLDSVLTLEEAIKMYRVITGACETGAKYFVENVLKTSKRTFTIKEIIELTEGQYGNSTFAEFFESGV